MFAKHLALLAAFFLSVLVTHAVHAQAASVVTKEAQVLGTSTPLTELELGQAFEYQLQWNCSIVSPPPNDCGTFNLVDPLPAGFVFDTCSVSSGLYTCVHDGGTNTVTIDLTAPNVLGDGDSASAIITGALSTDPALFPSLPAVLPNIATATIGEVGVIPATSSPTVNAPTNNWTISKTVAVPSLPLNPALDSDVIYRIQVCPNGPAGVGTGTIILENPVLTDACDPNATIVGATLNGVAISPTGMCPALDLNLGVTEFDPADGCQVIRLTAQYPTGPFAVTDMVTNTVDLSGDNITAGDCPNGCTAFVTSELDDPMPNAEIDKSAKRNSVGIGAFNEYDITFDTTNTNVLQTNVVIEDVFPTEITPVRLVHDGWADQTVAANIIELPSNTLLSAYNGVIGMSSGFSQNLSASATGFRVQFTTPVPPGFDGGEFTLQHLVDNPALMVSDTFQNCAGVTTTEITADAMVSDPQDCHTTTIIDDSTDIRLRKIMPTAVQPGNPFTTTFRFIQDNTSAVGADNPTVVDCLSSELEFVSWDTLTFSSGLDDPRDPVNTGNQNPIGVEPNLEVLVSGDAGFTCTDSNSVMLRWSWQDTAPVGSLQIGQQAGDTPVNNPFIFPIRPDRDGDNIGDASGDLGLFSQILLGVTLRVRPGILEATGIQNFLQTTQDNVGNLRCLNGLATNFPDVDDIDGDGDTTEKICRTQDTFNVLAAAALGGIKFVGGFPGLPNFDPANPPLDNTAAASNSIATPAYCPQDAAGRTRAPCVAQIVKGQPFNYQITLSNDGNVPLTNYVVYDVLPNIDTSGSDTGISEALAGVSRGSTWKPNLVGPIVLSSADATVTAALADAVIEYSALSNSCRPELSNANDIGGSGWQPGCVDDWTATPLADAITFPQGYASVKSWRAYVPFDTNSWPVGNPFSPDDENIVVDVSMLAPFDAPGSDYLVPMQEIAWNNIAHRASNASDTSRLLAAEIIKTGIIVAPGTPINSSSLRIGNLVWADANNDGIAQAGEQGLFDVTVELWNDVTGDGPTADDTLYDSTQTDAQGHYLFDDTNLVTRDNLGIPAGDYYVVIPSVQTGTFVLADNYSSAVNATNADDNVDNDDNGAFDSDDLMVALPAGFGGLYSGTVNLTLGAEPVNETLRNDDASDDDDDFFDDNDSNVSVDFGFYQLRLGNHIWLDSDDDGSADSGESAIEAMQIQLFLDDGDGVFDPTVDSALGTDTTDAQGQYIFDGLDIGNYFLAIPTGQSGLMAGGSTYTTSTITSSAGFTGALGLATDNDDDGAPGTFGGTSYAAASGLLALTVGGAQTAESDSSSNGVTGTSATDTSAPNAELFNNIEANFAFPDINSYLTVDFGFVPSVSLGSTIWVDSNADGTQDPGETAVAGATVTLLDNLGVPVDGEPSVMGTQPVTDITDVDGQYNFNNLVPGTYRISVNLGTSTVPNIDDFLPTPVQVNNANNNQNSDSNIDLNFDPDATDLVHFSRPITLQVGSEPANENDPINGAGTGVATDPDQPNQAGLSDTAGNMTLDMGFVPPVSLGSTLWVDDNEDGLQTLGETSIVNATVTLLNADGSLFDDDPYVAGVQSLTATTDADGQYNFDGLPVGDYRVQVDLALAANPNAAFLIPTPRQVADPDVPATAGFNNNTDSNIDAVFDPPANDQIYTSGVITLVANTEPVMEVDSIGAGGAGAADQPNQGLLATEDPDSSGNMTVDFGFIEPVSLGSTVWFDTNGDGLQTALEPPIIGAAVTLLNFDGTVYDSNPATPAIDSLTDTTDAQGQYNFNGLPEGDYRVQLDVTGVSSHTGAALDPTPPQVSDPDAPGVGQDNNTDSNIDVGAPGHNPATDTYQSGVVTLSIGGEPLAAVEVDPIGVAGPDQPNQTALEPDANGNMTVDFGFYSPVSLGSTIWNDTNTDGIQDSGEPAIVGAVVTLLDNLGGLIDGDPNTAGVQNVTATTDAAGQYNFDNLLPGTYRVRVDLGGVTNGADFLATPKQTASPENNDNTDSNIDTAFDTNTNDLIHTSGPIILSVGNEPTGEVDPINAAGTGTATDLDQPNQGLSVAIDPDSSGNMTLDMGFYKPVSLGSTLWVDANENGFQDVGEAPIVNATVTLLNGDGTVFDSNPNTAGIQALTDATDAQGQYNFNDLPEGDYRVQVNLLGATNPNAVRLVPTPSQVADPDAAGVGQNRNTDSNIDSAFDSNLLDQTHISGVITLSLGDEPENEVDPIGTPGDDQPNQTRTAADQPDANGNMTVDFGFIEPVSLGSTIWFDTNGDGMQTLGEAGIANVTVTLLTAAGAVYDSNPATVAIESLTATTDVDGQYNFNNLPTGDYRVRADLTAASSHTGPELVPTVGQVPDPDVPADANENSNLDTNVDVAAPGHDPANDVFESGIVTLSLGAEPTGEVDSIVVAGADQPNQTATQPDDNGNMTVDMGFIAPVSLGSTVWDDTNANGTQDAGEPAIAGATVTLLDSLGAVYDSNQNVAGVQALTAITDADGAYNFDGLAPGDYRVQVDLSTVTGGEDFIPTPLQVADPDAAGAGLDNNTDSNVDLAFDPITTDQIHTSGVITLTAGGEPTLEVDPINAAGNGTATDLDQPNQGLTPSTDPDNSGNMTVDFGFIRPVSVGSTVWVDSNENGTQDAGEPGIVGATVTLLTSTGAVYDGNPNTPAIDPVTSTTDANGQYNFNNLPEGSYRVQVNLVGATNSNATTFIPTPTQIANPDLNDNTDSNIDEVFDPTPTDQTHISGVIVLSLGNEPTNEADPIGVAGPDQPNQGLTAGNQPDANGNMTVDFGFIEPVSLGSTIWFDTNGDGMQTAAEPAIVGALVTLLNADGTVFDNDPVAAGIQALTDTTDADGQYNFNGLPTGDYRVQVDLTASTSHTGGELVPTVGQVPDPDAPGANLDSNLDTNVDVSAPGHSPATNVFQSGIVTLSLGGEPLLETDGIGAGGADQPNQVAATQPDANGNMTVDMGFIAPVSLGSTVWDDTNANGTQDAGEPAIAGATVTLLDNLGAVYDSNQNVAGVQALTAITDADGAYNFDGLAPGDYRVQVDLGTVTGGEDFIPTPLQVADPDAAGAGLDNNTDSNVDTAFDTVTTDQIHTSGVITLTAGGEPTLEVDPINAAGTGTATDVDQPNQGLTPSTDPDNSGNMTVDFGFIRPVSVGSTVWVDSNGDGLQTVGEAPIVGATVTLLNANGTVYDSNPATPAIDAVTDTTDVNGEYNFNDLPAGDYRVQVNVATSSNTNATFMVPTLPQVADPDGDDNTDSNIDTAFDPITTDQTHTSGIVTLSLGGEPENEADGIGVAGDDQPNQGRTPGNQPDVNGNMTVDFGFMEPVSLGSTVWFDSNTDGVQDDNEPPITGAVVTLLNSDNTVYDSDPNTAGVQTLTSTTDAEGQYNFNGLAAGSYVVQVSLSGIAGANSITPTPTQTANPEDNVNTDSNVASVDQNGTPLITSDDLYRSGIIILSPRAEPETEVDPIDGVNGNGPVTDAPNQTALFDGSGNMTVDFGFFQPVSLGSTVWEDINADGTQDTTEPAILGATITVLNADGTVFDNNPNVAGVQTLTDVTDADGQYNFNDLAPGDYRVQVDLSTVTGGEDYIATPVQVADPDAAGAGQDNNTDSNVDTAFDPITTDQIHTSGVITLSVGGEPINETDPINAVGTGTATDVDQPNQGLTVTQDPDNSGNMTVDFGFIRPVSVGSTVWVDSNENGTQDAGEPGIVGATVTLLTSTGAVYDGNPNTPAIDPVTSTTDANGQYNFNNLPEGSYRVQVNLVGATNSNATTFIPTPTQIANPDLNDNTDSNIDEVFDPTPTDQTHISGVIVLSLGNEPTNEADPIGVAGPDQPNQGLTAGNQPDANGNMTVDFGFIEPVSLGSTIWFDTNGDGMQTAAEPAIVGALVTLLNADGTVFDNDPVAAGIQALTDTTDADGQYNFNGLPTGDYRVQVDLTASTSHTGGELVPTVGQVPDPDAPGANLDSNLDTNVDVSAPGHSPATNVFQSGIVTLSLGGEPLLETDGIGAGGADQPNQVAATQPDANGNMTVDMGFIAPVSLGSTVWDDTNANGTQDAGEPAIAGATVTLLDNLGAVYDSNQNVAGVQALTAITDADGAYNFDGLAPGDYRVQVDLGTVTGGEDFIPTPLQVADPDAAGDVNSDSNVDTAFDTVTTDQIHTSGVITLTAGGEPTLEVDPINAAGNGTATDLDQPNQGLTPSTDPDNSGNMTVDFGFIRPVSVGSTVWVDSNENGTQDAGEPGIVGATVTLLTSTGAVYDGNPNTPAIDPVTSTTDANGQYNFNNLPEGSYRVQVNLVGATNSNATTFIPTPTQIANPDLNDNTDSNIDEVFDPTPTDQTHISGVIVLSLGNEPTNEADPIGVAGPDQPNQGLTAGNQPDANGNMTVDFGFIEPVSLGSTIWFDTNGDGMQTAAEPAIVGALVTLLNADGTVFDNDPVAAGIQALTDTTDADGQYNFNGLPTGDYRVQVDLTASTSHTGGELVPTVGQVPDPDAPGANLDSNLDTNVDVSAPGHSPATNVFQSGIVTLSLGGEPLLETDGIGAGGADQPNQVAATQPDANGNMTVDMGFIAPVSLGSTVWDDTNANGTQDAGEPAIAGATVTLLDNLGAVYDSNQNVAGVQALTAITDADGAYNFDGLAPGDYRVQVDLGTVTGGEDFIPTPLQVADPDAAGAGLDNNTDSNVDTAFDTVTTDQIHTSGVITLTAGGEPTLEVDPINAAGTGTATDVDQPNQGLTPSTDPDNSGNMTVDFGFIRPVSVGSTVWVDSNGDGLQTVGEAPIVGATVTLLNANGTVYDSNPATPAIDAVTDTTDVNGEYNFNDLPAGDYRVQVNVATSSNTNATFMVPTLPQVADPDGDDNTDSNIDTAFDPITTDQTHTSGIVTLSLGGEPENEADGIGVAGDDQPNQGRTPGNQPDVNGNMTVDFGFMEPVSLGSTVWFDSNTDGVQDDNEPPITGAVVTLLNSDNTVYDSDPNTAGVQTLTSTTDAEGQYNFNGLAAGSYVVQVSLSGIAGANSITPTPTQTANPEDNVNTDSNVASVDQNGTPLITSDDLYRSGIIILSPRAEPETEVDPIDGVNGNGPVTDAPNQTALFDGSGNMTVDFGFFQPVSLGSTVWEDTDGDGTQDAGELAIQGASVTLLTASGVPVSGVSSVLTNAQGEYNFDGLVPGDYRVRVDLSTVTGGADLFPSPVQIADPDLSGDVNEDSNTDSNIDLVFDTTGTNVITDQVHTSGIVTLATGTEPVGETDPISVGGADQPNQDLLGVDPDASGNMTVDFGFVRPVSLGSTIWQDENADGIQNDGEAPIAGATIVLLNSAGTPIDTAPYTPGVQPAITVTDSLGQYFFNGLPPGDYRVQVDLSTVTGGAALIPSPNQVPDPDLAGDNNLDSNVDSAFDTNLSDQIHTSGVVTLTAGGEPTAEVDPIDLVDGNGNVIDAPGQNATTPDNSGNMTVDMGFYAPVSVGSFIWKDLDADGFQDASEPPLAGAFVQLFVETTPGVFIPATTVTGGMVPGLTVGLDGVYEFDNLLPGNYKVQVMPPAGFFPSPVQNVTPDSDITDDSNIASELGMGVYESAVFSVTSGGEVAEAGPDASRGDNQDGVPDSAEDLSGNMTIDFGFVPPASLGNYVWMDLDMDGIQDANEDGIANVTVNLYRDGNRDGVIDGAEATTPVAVAITGPNGEYKFSDLEPGVVYQTGVDTSTLITGLVQTFDEGDGLGATDSLSVPIIMGPNEFHETADFGYAPAAGVGAVGDTIWVDANDDGVQDPGEPGIAGVTVSITPAPGVDLGAGPGIAITTVTDANGKYLFPNLPLNQTYIVEVITASLPAGYTTGPSNLGDPDVRDGNSVNADNQTTVVLTAQDPINLDLDFGYLPPASQNNTVGDTIWIDVDVDGEGPAGANTGADVGELAVPGVTVSLLDASGNVVGTTITDANGQYLFTGLPDGIYTVLVTDQNNVLNGLVQTYDSDDGVNSNPTTPNRSTVDLDSGGSSSAPVDNRDQDFGYTDPNLSGGNGSIGDTIFFDEDSSGTFDSGEGLEGVTVQLFAPGPDGEIGGGDDVLIGSTTTDANGNYLFTGLDTSDTGPNPGTEYQVVVDLNSLPNGGAGWTNSVDPDSALNAGDNESLTVLTTTVPTDLDQDFGYGSDDGNSLNGTIWPDTNGDGQLGEGGRYAGVTVELRDLDGNVIATTITDASGDFSFENLPDGMYMVVVTDDDNVLAGFEHTDSPNGTGDSSDSTSKDDTGYTVDLDSAGTTAAPVADATSDFGYKPAVTNPITLGSFVAKRGANGVVDFEWVTQTEVANIGFNLYGQIDGVWVQLNSDMIVGLGDSVLIQSYAESARTVATVFALSDVDLTGKETIHGPFQLASQYGVISERRVIDWGAERREREVKRSKRRAAKKAHQSMQLKRRNSELKSAVGGE